MIASQVVAGSSALVLLTNLALVFAFTLALALILSLALTSGWRERDRESSHRRHRILYTSIYIYICIYIYIYIRIDIRSISEVEGEPRVSRERQRRHGREQTRLKSMYMHVHGAPSLKIPTAATAVQTTAYTAYSYRHDRRSDADDLTTDVVTERTQTHSEEPPGEPRKTVSRNFGECVCKDPAQCTLDTAACLKLTLL